MATATTAAPRRHSRRPRRDATRQAPARPRGWKARAAWRTAIVLLALVAGASVIRSSRPTALDAALARVESGAAPADPAVEALVARSLAGDVTTPAAIELAALARETRGEHSAAADLYRLSDLISRRSLATRLWLVQDAVERGDVAATLAHMDLALRTSSAAPDIVFPALARGLEDPALVAPIAALVDRPSDWREAFVAYAVSNARPEAAAALVLAMRNVADVADRELDRKLIVRLVDAGQVASARRLDARFPGAPRAPGLLADGQFADSSARYPFGWGLTDAYGLGAARATEGGRPVLAWHAGTAERGQVAAQVLTLPEGRYTLDTRTARSDASGTGPLWTLSCAGQSRTLATLAVPAGAGQRRSTPFAVPPDCTGQWLTLTLRPALAPQAGAIAGVSVTPE